MYHSIVNLLPAEQPLFNWIKEAGNLMKAPSPFIITTLCDFLMMGKGSYFLECIFYFLD
jgi:hypothetical protein